MIMTRSFGSRFEQRLEPEQIPDLGHQIKLQQ